MAKIGKGIYLRGDVYWLAIQVKGVRRFVSLQTKEPGEALTRAEQVRQHSEFTPSTGFDAEMEDFLRHKLTLNQHAPRTSEWSRGVLTQFGKHVHNRSASQVTQDDVESFYRKLRARMTENGCHSYFGALKAFFSWSVKKRLRFDNPVSKVKLGRRDQPARERFATKKIRDKLISKCKDQSLKFVLYCAFHAGMRRNEICEARPNWFNVKDGFITIEKTATFRTKNRKSRTVPLTTPFRKFLRAYGMREPFMLKPEVPHGRARYRYDFRLPWTRYMEAHGVAWITPHTARHTFASLLAAEGLSLFKIAKWIGDTVDVCERHYAHLSPDDRSIDRML